MHLRPRTTLLATLALLVLAVALLLAPQAVARGATTVAFEGGTAAQRSQVTQALAASRFDWGVLSGRVTVHIARGVDSYALPGHVWLDADLLDAGRFSWGVVLHEFAHEIDFLLLTDEARRTLLPVLGGHAWCTESDGHAHGEYACERFASTFAWAFWPSKDNCMKPAGPRDESAALPPADFRALLAQTLKTPALRKAAP
jgi:hypothetical protein